MRAAEGDGDATGFAEPLTKQDFEALAQFRFVITRAPDPGDRRGVRVHLSDNGEWILLRLSAAHRDQLQRMATALAVPTWLGGLE